MYVGKCIEISQVYKHFMPFGRTYRTLLFNTLSAGHGNLGDERGQEKLEKSSVVKKYNSYRRKTTMLAIMVNNYTRQHQQNMILELKI